MNHITSSAINELNWVQTLVETLTNRFAALLEAGDSSVVVRRPEIAALIEIASHANPESRRSIAEELRKEIDPPTIGQIAAMGDLNAKWEEMVPRFRVLCFSELHDVTPMWLHYSDNYRGMVLEFSAVDAVDSAFLVARPIVYQDEPPPIIIRVNA